MKTSQYAAKPRSESGKRAAKQRGTQTEAVRGGRSGLSGMKPIKDVRINETITPGVVDVMGKVSAGGIGSAEAM